MTPIMESERAVGVAIFGPLAAASVGYFQPPDFEGTSRVVFMIGLVLASVVGGVVPMFLRYFAKRFAAYNSLGYLGAFFGMVAGYAVGIACSQSREFLPIISMFTWLLALVVSELKASPFLDGSGERVRVYTGDLSPEQGDGSVDYPFNFTRPKGGLDTLAGMSELKAELTKVIAPFRAYKDKKSVVSDRNGILLSGPPGNGKSAFAQAIAGELGLRFVKVDVSDVSSQWVNETPKVLKSLFDQASTEPTVVFFDEFDAVARARDDVTNNEDKKTVDALLSKIDSARKFKLVLIAATNYPDKLDRAIIRDGRFDFRIEIPNPDTEARFAILSGLLTKHNIKATDATRKKVAELWEGRSVAFMEGAVKRIRDDGLGQMMAVTVEEFKAISRAAGRKPSALPKHGPTLSELTLDSNVKEEADSLLYRLANWEKIAERGGEVPSGVLLYGPPGTGKTQLVKSMARQLGNWHVFEVSATEVIKDPSKFREVVQLAADHRPAFVFLDEADELLKDRNMSQTAGATNEILKAMDGMMGKIPEVVFIAATNNPEAIDAAALRGGRFAEKIHVPLLSGLDLERLFNKEMQTRGSKIYEPAVTGATLVGLFGALAPADALAVMRKAVNYTLTDNGDRRVSIADFVRAKEALAL